MNYNLGKVQPIIEEDLRTPVIQQPPPSGFDDIIQWAKDNWILVGIGVAAYFFLFRK